MRVADTFFARRSLVGFLPCRSGSDQRNRSTNSRIASLFSQFFLRSLFIEVDLLWFSSFTSSDGLGAMGTSGATIALYTTGVAINVLLLG